MLGTPRVDAALAGETHLTSVAVASAPRLGVVIVLTSRVVEMLAEEHCHHCLP